MSKRGKHVSVEKELRQSVGWLEGIPEIERVILGTAESCRHKYTPGMIRVRSRVPGGLHLSGYGGLGGQAYLFTC